MESTLSARTLRVALALANLSILYTEEVFAQPDQQPSFDMASSDSTQQLVDQRRHEEYQSSLPEAKQLTASMKSEIMAISPSSRVTVTTDDDNVMTLRGSVSSVAERKKIEKKAEELAGWAYVRSFITPR